MKEEHSQKTDPKKQNEETVKTKKNDSIRSNGKKDKKGSC